MVMCTAGSFRVQERDEKRAGLIAMICFLGLFLGNQKCNETQWDHFQPKSDVPAGAAIGSVCVNANRCPDLQKHFWKEKHFILS